VGKVVQSVGPSTSAWPRRMTEDPGWTQCGDDGVNVAAAFVEKRSSNPAEFHFGEN